MAGLQLEPVETQKGGREQEREAGVPLYKIWVAF